MPVSLSTMSPKSASITASPFLTNKRATITVTIRATTAGIKSAIMTWLNSSPKPLAAAIVLALGEMMFPALPPPDKATKRASLEICIRRPTSRAIGATIKTATGMKTPTAVMTIVARASDKIAIRSPSLSTIVRAKVSAAPDSIITPASIPAASTRSTVPMTLCSPLTRMSMVPVRLAPPSKAPIIAPSIRE